MYVFARYGENIFEMLTSIAEYVVILQVDAIVSANRALSDLLFERIVIYFS